MFLLITGASGYIGTHLRTRAEQQGHQVYAATRAGNLQDPCWRPYDLRDTSALQLPENTQVVVHLAASLGDDENALRYDVQAAHRLLEATSRQGARLIFISSQVARADAPTVYGRIKWQIEQEVLSRGGSVIRPGLVYGGEEQGLFGTLTALVRILPLLPAFLPAPRVYPVHVDDLTDAILACASSNAEAGKACNVGAPESVSFTHFLRQIAQYRVQTIRLFVPVPTIVVRMAMRLLGKRLCEKLGLTRLNSLFDLPAFGTADDLARLALTLRPLAQGLQRTFGRRRTLIREGHTLLSYLLKRSPSPSLVGRYVRLCEQTFPHKVLDLPRICYKWPVLIAALDSHAEAAQLLRQRLEAALYIAEASVSGAKRFLLLNAASGRIKTSLRIVFAAMPAVALLLLLLIMRPLRIGHAKERVI